MSKGQDYLIALIPSRSPSSIVGPILFCCFFWLQTILLQPVFATRLPPELAKITERKFENARIRLDGSLECQGDHLYLPLVPAVTPVAKKKEQNKVEIASVYPEGSKRADIVFYTNGWGHILLQKKGEACIPALHANMPDSLRKKLIAMKFPSDLIVPQGFVIPRSYKDLIQDVPTIACLDDNIIFNPDFGDKKKHLPEEYKGNGSLFLTSITSGSITMLDGKTLKKIAEFPTEGTPCSIAQCSGLVYVADQGKNRVLVVDPLTRKFHGQIDLPPHSAPKGVCALPDGKVIYVSESASGAVSCIETATGKTLVRTKTHPGPGRMAMTPDGIFFVVLDVTSGEASIISTYNQSVVSTLRIGDVPSCVVIARDSKLAYISCRLSNTVAVLDIPGRRVVNTIKTGQHPTGLALSPDGGHLYVSCARENNITIYDTRTLSKINEVHTPPEVEFAGYIYMMPDGKRLLVCSQQSDALAVLDTQTMQFEKSISIGHSVHEAAWEPVP